MRVTNLLSLGLASLLGAGLTLSTGCVDDERHEMNKPVIENEYDETEADLDATGEAMENDAEEAWNDTKEAAEDATDAVVPDEEKVDVDSPLGDVNVSEDPVTGDVNVDVDADKE
ncbi:hypothetical protein Pla123a_28460 [Posidoniimonas polymericola]|uniref:Uncharacterized protein n=1 Tax=Posidoniimonas polymericola TaxID=2528002 RepID=A0A5C5YMJ3_9BACT|nr:hypothetical protein [Posidoniimonas polymericola]TWT76059.1 hypothetical protein Pla123a_28460 [Posidoniimonas polymericola]